MNTYFTAPLSGLNDYNLIKAELNGQLRTIIHTGDRSCRFRHGTFFCSTGQQL